METKEFNIASNSKNEIEVGLSNLSHNPFELNGITYASIESFWQSLKFEKGSELWLNCINLFGPESKKYGKKSENKSIFSYEGNDYIVGSQEHQNLMKIALKAQLNQNSDKLKLLLSTGNIDLIHKPQKEDGSYYADSKTIPGEVFSRFLMELREEFREFSNIENNTKMGVNNILIEKENEINIFDSFKIEFINSDKNPYGFSIMPPSGYDVYEKIHDGYLLLKVRDGKNRKGKNFLFDKNKSQITWAQRSEEVKDYIEIQEFDGYKVELRKKVDVEKEIEDYVYKIYKGDNLVKTGETLANGILNTPETIYKKFVREEALKSEEQKKEEAYKNSSLNDRASHWFKMCWYYLREGEKFNIKEIREKREPEIDKMVNGMIEGIMELSDMNREDVIFRHFILDEESNKYVKTSSIEGINISEEQLVENVGDLFYDSLSSFLDTLGDKISDFSKIESELEKQEKSLKLQLISENLKKSSNHIMTAWQICLPYISHNFPVMKHTSEIKGIDISKEELAVKISKLEYEKLYDFLNKLSNKIYKDGKADEKRGRKKLSNELFEAARLIKV